MHVSKAPVQGPPKTGRYFLNNPLNGSMLLCISGQIENRLPQIPQGPSRIQELLPFEIIFLCNKCRHPTSDLFLNSNRVSR